MAFKIRQNAFPAGVPSGTLWESSSRSLDSLVGCGGDISPYATIQGLPTSAVLRSPFGAFGASV